MASDQGGEKKRRRRKAADPAGGMGTTVDQLEYQMRWNGLYLLYKRRAMNNAGLAPPMPWLSATEPIS